MAQLKKSFQKKNTKIIWKILKSSILLSYYKNIIINN